MNLSWVRYIPVVLIITFFAACGHKSNNAEGYVNPILKTDPAVKDITEQINNNPKDASLYFKRGKILYKIKQDTLALNDFKKAAALDSTRAQYFSAVGDLLFEHKDISGSVQWFKKAIALNPSDVTAHKKIAKLFLYTEDFSNGFAEINLVLRKNPYDGEAYFLKGMLYEMMKDTAKAISSFETARSVAPDYQDPVVQIGLLYSAQKNPMALSYLDNAFKIDSADVFPLFTKGVYYKEQKDDVHPKELFRECIIRNTHYVNAYFNMGFILIGEDSFAKAYRQFDIVTKIDPGNPAAYYNRGVCSELMDSIGKAIEDYKMALSIDSSYKSPKDALRNLKALK